MRYRLIYVTSRPIRRRKETQVYYSKLPTEIMSFLEESSRNLLYLCKQGEILLHWKKPFLPIKIFSRCDNRTRRSNHELVIIKTEHVLNCNFYLIYFCWIDHYSFFYYEKRRGNVNGRHK